MSTHGLNIIQELALTIGATLFSLHEDDGHSGARDIRIWKFLLSEPGMMHQIGTEEYDRISEHIREAEESELQNKRNWVKKIQLGDSLSYPPWESVKIPAHRIAVLNANLETVKLRLQLVNGKLYAVPVLEDLELTTVIYSEFKDLISKGCRPNIETSHITCVNSNIIAPLDEKKVEQFIASHSEPFTVVGKSVKSTTSKDWARFSRCYVLEVESSVLEQYLSEFNTEFGTKVKISLPRITFAVRPRDIAENMPE